MTIHLTFLHTFVLVFTVSWTYIRCHLSAEGTSQEDHKSWLYLNSVNKDPANIYWTSTYVQNIITHPPPHQIKSSHQKQVRFCDFTPSSSGWLILPPPTWETKTEVHCTSSVLSHPHTLALLVPTTQSNVRGQSWPVEGVWWKRLCQLFSGCKAGKSPYFQLSLQDFTWPMRGCMGWLELPPEERQVIYST